MHRTIIFRLAILCAAIGGLAAAGRPAAAADKIDDVHPDERAAFKALQSEFNSFTLNAAGRVESLRVVFAPDVRDEQMADVASLAQLKSLDLSGAFVSDDGLAQLQKLAGLESLAVPLSGVKMFLALNGNWAVLGAKLFAAADDRETVERLREELFRLRITDKGVANLAGLVQLKELSLSFTSLTDEGLKSLVRMTKLNALALVGTEISDAGMPELLPLVNLEKLGLDYTAVSDAGIQKLAGLKQLRHLSLEQTLVSAQGVRRLRAAMPDLEITPEKFPTASQVEAIRTLRSFGAKVELDDQGRAITAAIKADSHGILLTQLRTLAMLGTLEELDLTHIELTDDDIAGHLGPLKRLKTLTIDNVEANFSGLMQLLIDQHKHTMHEALKIVGVGQPDAYGHVKPLNLGDPFAREQTIKYFKLIPSLEQLDLSGAEITDARLAQLAELTELKELHLAGQPITDKGIAALAKLSHLEILDLSRTAVTDAGLRLLPTNQLKALRLDHTGVTDAGVLDIAARSDLKLLSLRYTQVSAEAAEKITADHTKLTIQPNEFPAAAIARQVAEIDREGILLSYDGRHNLTEVLFEQAETTDADLEKLAKIPTIKVLHLKGDQVTLAGCQAIAQLTHLEELGFRGVPLTDAMAANLAGLDKLTWLDLTGTGVSDKGLGNLSGLSRLTWIGLGETSITDAGLLPLEKLPNLQEVNLLDTKVTDQGVERLQDSLPACKIRVSRPSTAE